jgi:hypothetical protein
MGGCKERTSLMMKGDKGQQLQYDFLLTLQSYSNVRVSLGVISVSVFFFFQRTTAHASERVNF